MTSGVDDEAVIARVLDGDTQAFETLVERYQTHVTRIVVTKVPHAVVEELVHETFVRTFRSLNGYSARKPFGHWLSRIAVRCCYDYWREHYRRREVPVSALSDDAGAWLDAAASSDSAEAFESLSARQEAREVLDWALDRLSATDRMILTLTYLEGHTTAEAAELMGISQANVKVRSFRARARLKNIIGKTMPG